MSWDQEYSVPSLINLLEQLTGKTSEQLLLAELNSSGVSIVNREEVLLSDGFMFDVMGIKVTLSDGRVFVPKLVEQFNENGNHGVDVYEYHLQDHIPDVRYVGVDTSESPDYTATTEVEYDSDGLPIEEDLDLGELTCGDDGCGCGF